MTRVFENGDFKEFKIACSNKTTILILCKTDKTSFGLLIVDPIIFSSDFGQWNSSSLICAFNIAQRKEFKGEGRVRAADRGKEGVVEIGDAEVVIMVDGKRNYRAYSYSGKKILQITQDENGINAITQEEVDTAAELNILEVYA